MYMAGTMAIPGGDYRALVDHWYAMPYAAGGRDKGELRTVAEMLLPAYIDAVTEGGIAPLDMGDPMLWTLQNRELRAYLVDRTSYAGETVDNFLLVLDDAVSAGAVDAKYLQPETWEEIAPPTLSEQILSNPLTASVGGELSKQITTITIAAAAVAAAVLLGKAAIAKL